jgi:hypothetical protein
MTEGVPVVFCETFGIGLQSAFHLLVGVTACETNALTIAANPEERLAKIVERLAKIFRALGQALSDWQAWYSNLQTAEKLSFWVICTTVALITVGVASLYVEWWKRRERTYDINARFGLCFEVVIPKRLSAPAPHLLQGGRGGSLPGSSRRQDALGTNSIRHSSGVFRVALHRGGTRHRVQMPGIGAQHEHRRLCR